MLAIRKPKIGLVGVMSAPFQGDNESGYASDRQSLEDLSTKFKFDLSVIEKGVYDLPQAKKAAATLAEWGADFILIQTSSFASGDLLSAFIDLPARLGIWAVPENPPGSTGGLPKNSFAAANMYNSMIRSNKKGNNLAVKWFLGRANSFDFIERLGVSAAALRALVNLPESRVALVRGVIPRSDSLLVDHALLKEKLGVEVVEFELDQILARGERINENLVSKTMRELRAAAASFDHSQSKALEKTARVYQSVMALAEEHQFVGVAMSCASKFQSDFGLDICTVIGHLNTQGIIAVADEDAASSVSMLLLRWLSNGDPVTLLQVLSIDHSDQSVLLWNSGSTTPVMADERGMHLQAAQLMEGPSGRRSGLHNDLVLRPGPGTILGLMPNMDKMFILEGSINPHKASYQGSRGWLKNLHLNLDPITTSEFVQTLMSSGFQHYFPFAYGSQSAAALELCAWLGIEPIKKQAYTSYLIG